MKTSFFNKLFKPFRFFSRMSERLTRYLSDLQDMAPYHIRMMSQSYSGKSNTFSGSDFSRREHLIYSWLSMDHVYFGKVSSEAARHWIALGDLHSSELYPASGRRFFEKAVGILRQIKDADDPVLLAALKKLADCNASCTRDNEALVLYLEMIDLTALVSGAEYPAIESDLHRLAELHELRNEGADKTVAFHYRAKARRIKERRERRTKFKSMLAGFFISINSIQEALYVVAYEYAADIGFALSAFL